MSTILDEVNRRANLALSNQMEMLIFYLADNQLYGINVFKIIEIIECPKVLTKLPLANEAVCGAVDFRGNPVTVIDLGYLLGLPRLDYSRQICYIVICDYNNAVNGFLIVNPGDAWHGRYSFVRKIRENPLTSDLKVILHSSLSNPSNKLKAEAVAATDFVAKFKPDVLANTILHHLGIKSRG